jgi:hypothetical protein
VAGDVEFTKEQDERLHALDCVLHLFRGGDQPDVWDLLAMADWVRSGHTAEAEKVAERTWEHYGKPRAGL